MFHYRLAYSTFAKQAKMHCSNLSETHQKTKRIAIRLPENLISNQHIYNQVQHPILQMLSS